LGPLVKQCMPIHEKIEAKIRKICKVDELMEIFPDILAFTGATLEEIPRPKDKQKRKDF